jgi:hypothetical protein
MADTFSGEDVLIGREQTQGRESGQICRNLLEKLAGKRPFGPRGVVIHVSESKEGCRNGRRMCGLTTPWWAICTESEEV